MAEVDMKEEAEGPIMLTIKRQHVLKVDQEHSTHESTGLDLEYVAISSPKNCNY